MTRVAPRGAFELAARGVEPTRKRREPPKVVGRCVRGRGELGQRDGGGGGGGGGRGGRVVPLRPRVERRQQWWYICFAQRLRGRQLPAPHGGGAIKAARPDARELAAAAQQQIDARQSLAWRRASGAGKEAPEAAAGGGGCCGWPVEGVVERSPLAKAKVERGLSRAGQLGRRRQRGGALPPPLASPASSNDGSGAPRASRACNGSSVFRQRRRQPVASRKPTRSP